MMTSLSVRSRRLAATASACFCCLSSHVPAQTGDEALRILARPPESPRAQGVLRDYLRQASRIAFDRRTERFETLKSPADIAAYQQELRERFLHELGGFPARTPLNARVIGTLAGEGFRMEKVIFESQPGFHVTANFYIPDGPAPHPVVLMPCGHFESGKAGYQQAAVTLVKSGVAVFCYDPIGQGERRQLVPGITVDGDVAAFEPTQEHTISNIAPILLGRSLATAMIWDGVRAIDYLETRTEIDATRIGCVGNSGGGMMTSYLVALEERIVAAALGCFMTTSQLKNESPGPGDAEQNIHAQYRHGIDFPDYLIMFAPRPALICAATRDFVPIAGTWDAFRQAKRVYTRLGYAEHVDLIETDAPHGFSQQLREGAARWMRRHLLGRDDAVFEKPSTLFSDEQLQCTPAGSVLRLAGARSVHDLNREESARLAAERKPRWAARSPAARRAAVREVAGIRPLDELPTADIQDRGTIQRPGFRIDRHIVTPVDGVPLPLLRFRPENANGTVILYLNGRGMADAAAVGGPIEQRVRAGAEVIAVDLRGFGETAMRPWRYGPPDVTGNNGAEFYVAYMLGRPLLGMRAEDVLLIARWLAQAETAGLHPLELVALDEATLPALHAAALEPRLFARVELIRSIDSWERVIEAAIPRWQLESATHGALRVYDLPDLVELAGHVAFIDPVDATGRPLE